MWAAHGGQRGALVIRAQDLLTEEQVEQDARYQPLLQEAANPSKKKRLTKRAAASTSSNETKPSLVAYDKVYREQILLTAKLRKFIEHIEDAYLYGVPPRARYRGAGGRSATDATRRALW